MNFKYKGTLIESILIPLFFFLVSLRSYPFIPSLYPADRPIWLETIPFFDPEDEIKRHRHKQVKENVSPHNAKVLPACTPRDVGEGEDLVGI